MMERRQCEFFLIRYVPDTVRGEFVNIGVLLREAEHRESTLLRFTKDWSRVRCVDPDADVAVLEGLEAEMLQRLASGPDEIEALLRTIEDSFSNSVQLTKGKAYLAESLITGLEQLSGMYVEAKKRPGTRRRSGRQAIAAEMRKRFEAAKVWDAMRKRISAAAYTRPGDPLRLDCGYRPNGVVRMFQAVSLEGDVEAAKGLAFSAPKLIEGVARVEKASLQLTAIIEPLAELREKYTDDEYEDRMQQYRFGVEAMEEQSIRVLTVNDLVRVAETARRELGM